MGYEINYIGGWVGGSGSGKSLSLACAIVWELLKGKKVWSNMKVNTSPAIINRSQFINGEKIEYKETVPLDWDLLYMLDDSLVEGTIAIDEIGYFADSRQSASTKNRLINACIRQVRHRNLNVFYTAKGFNRVDNRLRDETDFLVDCEDMSFKPWGEENNVVGGIVVKQKYYDISGKMTGKMQEYFSADREPYKLRLFYGRPYWECYDTREIISLEEAFTGVKLDLQQRYISNRTQTDDEELKNKIYDSIVELSKSNETITGDVLWAHLGSKGIEGDPRQLGRYIPRSVKRKQSRTEGYLYDLTNVA